MTSDAALRWTATTHMWIGYVPGFSCVTNSLQENFCEARAGRGSPGEGAFFYGC